MKWRVRTRDRNAKAIEREVDIVPERSAVFVMDVWDRHWCADVNRRLPALIPAMDATISRLREAGFHILHMPADCMDFYKDHPQRRRILEQPKRFVSRLVYYGIPHIPLLHGKFPVRLAEEGGCPCSPHCDKPMVWTRQHEGITIGPADGIAADPKEVVTYLKNQHIGHILYLGLHANICILKRPTGIRKMKALGYQCILMRDLTDVMYDPRNWPFTDHENAVERVIEHIEQHICPTAISTDL